MIRLLGSQGLTSVFSILCHQFDVSKQPEERPKDNSRRFAIPTLPYLCVALSVVTKSTDGVKDERCKRGLLLLGYQEDNGSSSRILWMGKIFLQFIFCTL